MEFYSGQPENPAASVRDYCTGVLTPACQFLNKALFKGIWQALNIIRIQVEAMAAK